MNKDLVNLQKKIDKILDRIPTLTRIGVGWKQYDSLLTKMNFNNPENFMNEMPYKKIIIYRIPKVGARISFSNSDKTNLNDHRSKIIHDWLLP